MTAIVTLLTDFGAADSYVAEVKGRLLLLAPGVTLVDVTHAIEPGDIGGAAFVLGRAWPVFPDGTVHLAVGRSYTEAGGKNISAVHWDMIKDLRANGALYLDGNIVQKNGKFLI